ncbi:MAG: RusA family crossover junction endodeoxyribonuclease [Nitrospira sp.]|nr:RusA family crossover junction endodeoxyribonuclease [Nitrospira sp.]
MLNGVVIYGQPMGKPRMTRKDQFLTQKRTFRTEADARRAEKLRQYFDWCNGARAQAQTPDGITLDRPTALSVRAYLAMPASWSQKKKTQQIGAPHVVTPDGDNILKGICDALFVNDQMIYRKIIEKRWDDGRGPRVEVATW